MIIRLRLMLSEESTRGGQREIRNELRLVKVIGNEVKGEDEGEGEGEGEESRGLCGQGGFNELDDLSVAQDNPGGDQRE